MYPILLKIGPITIYTYGSLLCLAFLAALWVAGREAQRVGLPSGRIWDLGFYLLAAALVGARALEVLLNLHRYVETPLDIFKVWDGGLAFQGGLLLAFITALAYIRRHGLPVWGTLDALALGIPLGQSIGRIGCFMAGCCYGRPTELPWGVTFTHPESLGPLGVKVHPTQLYESLLVLGVLAVLYHLRTRKRFDGQLLGTYFLLAGLARFVVEFFRGDPRGPAVVAGMPVTQLTALVMALVGAVLLIMGFCRLLPGPTCADGLHP
jgi:phosphatidylglycerol:prolipoprotein diacylglycerol transferase